MRRFTISTVAALVLLMFSGMAAADTAKVTPERADILVDANAGYGGYIPALSVESAWGTPEAMAPAASAAQAPPAAQPGVQPASAPPVVTLAPAPQPQTSAPAHQRQTHTAQATQPAPQENKQKREGLWIGLGLGYGSYKRCADQLGCSDRQGSVSGYLKLGGTLTPHLLLGGEFVGWVKDYNGTTLTVGGLYATATGYPVLTSGFFLKGGLGVSYHRDSGDHSSGTVSVSKTGLGFIAGVGYDLRVGRNVSITPTFDYVYGNVGDFLGTTGNRDDVLQFAVGVTFH